MIDKSEELFSKEPQAPITKSDLVYEKDQYDIEISTSDQ